MHVIKNILRFIFIIFFFVVACNRDDNTISSIEDQTVSQITVSSPQSQITLGGSNQIQFSASAKNAAGQTLNNVQFSWHSSNTNLATVNSSGLVTISQVGQVTISASTQNITGQKTITINSAPSSSLPSMAWPLERELHDKVFISNYVDLNSGSGIQDYNCGTAHSYNGHSGTDIAILNYRLMDQGVAVLAAADGVVASLDDDNFDRNYWLPYQGAPNFVSIDYPNQSYSVYVHLRKNSVGVKVGEQVKVGDFLGYIATSGSTPLPHLHFENREWITQSNNPIVDPFQGACQSKESLWITQPEYVGNAPLRILDADIFTNFTLTGGHQFGEERVFKDRPLRPAVYGTDQLKLGFWVQVQGNAGQSYTIEIKKPDGSIFQIQNASLETKRRYGWYGFNWDFSSITSNDYGEWTATIIGGIEEFSVNFEVGPVTEYGPRFYPLAGKSFKIGSSSQDQLVLHGTSPAVTFELINAPPGISLNGNMVSIGPGQSTRNHHFQVKATDSKGRSDLMYYHLVDLSKPIN